MKDKCNYPLFMAAALLAMLAAPFAFAVTFNVNSILDQPDDLTIPGTCHTAAGTCTLRAAVMQANRTSGIGATIVLPAGPPYTLTIPAAGVDGEGNGDLNLITPASGNPVIAITGAGAATTIIDANQLDRVLHVHAGRTATISGVTIRNGYVSGAAASGGGIYNDGSLTVSGATITANHGTYLGGGIFNSGSLTVMNSTLSQNVADVGGGGIDNYFSSNLDVLNSTLSQNTALTGGGGIVNNGTMKVSKSTIVGNVSYDGGGIFADNATTYVIDSTISQNYAYNNGGGIHESGSLGLIALYSTSVIGNDADHDADMNGGIGGGVYSEAGSRFIVVNTLIAANTVVNSPIYDDCNGTLEAYGMNLFGEVSACLIPNAGNRGFVSLSTIGPLQNNGGPTQTHALLAGSEAINSTIDALGCVNETGAVLTTDQRGAPRVAGVRCDVGAYEYGVANAPTLQGAKSRKAHGVAGTFDLPL